MDTQQIGIIGKHVLIANLLAANLEVAEPIRDHGIDLIVFRDDKKDGGFLACPVQLKAATDEAFELYSKYERFPGLKIVYVWNLRDPKDARFYCLTYLEAVNVLKKMQGAQFSILEEKEHLVTTKPSKALKDMLKEFQVNAPKEWPCRFGMTESNPVSPKPKQR
jgi:hypothetical protein